MKDAPKVGDVVCACDLQHWTVMSLDEEAGDAIVRRDPNDSSTGNRFSWEHCLIPAQDNGSCHVRDRYMP